MARSGFENAGVNFTDVNVIRCSVVNPNCCSLVITVYYSRLNEQAANLVDAVY